jgi:hypothetical protein
MTSLIFLTNLLHSAFQSNIQFHWIAFLMYISALFGNQLFYQRARRLLLTYNYLLLVFFIKNIHVSLIGSFFYSIAIQGELQTFEIIEKIITSANLHFVLVCQRLIA